MFFQRLINGESSSTGGSVDFHHFKHATVAMAVDSVSKATLVTPAGRYG